MNKDLDFTVVAKNDIIFKGSYTYLASTTSAGK